MSRHRIARCLELPHAPAARRVAAALLALALAACADGPGGEPAFEARALAVYGDGPNTCDGYGVNSFAGVVNGVIQPGGYDCRNQPWATIPITEQSCPAAQWLWTTRDKGNAYCAQHPYTGPVDWAPDHANAYAGPHVAVVQEIAGIWVSKTQGCSKNVRVCIGTPTNPAVTDKHGVRVWCNGAWRVTGNAGCAPCYGGLFAVPPGAQTVTDMCCPMGRCERSTVSVTMNDGGHVVSDYAGIDCTTGTCAADFSDQFYDQNDRSVGLTLTRVDGYVDWTGWGGACPVPGATDAATRAAALADTCVVQTNVDRQVTASHQLGGTVSGALDPAGPDGAPLPRDHSALVAARASTLRVDLNGADYTFAQSGVCECFATRGATFYCARSTTGSGTVTATHDPSGAARVFHIDFVARRGPARPGDGDSGPGMGACQRLGR